MFVQVINGKVRDEDQLRRQVDAWREQLAPGAEGWLGTTAGVADDGEFVAIVRFESEEAARANSQRPEQGAWWEETTGAFDGAVTFANCPMVDIVGDGGSDDAGFVQVIYGRADRDAVLPHADEMAEGLRRMRPDVIGASVSWPGDGTFVEAVYFTSEDEARAGEAREVSPEDAERAAAFMALFEFERFVDLRRPWLASAG